MQFVSRGVVFLSLCLFALSVFAKQYQVAVISDGPYEKLDPIENLMVAELQALTGDEFNTTVQHYRADWTLQGIKQQFQQAYNNPEIDMLLVTGVAANQIGVALEQFTKPTFFPMVFDIKMMEAPVDDRVSHGISSDLPVKISGKTNLNYLTSGLQFKQSLTHFMRVTPLKKVALLGDELLFESLSRVIAYSNNIANIEGVELVFIGHDGTNHSLTSQIPQDVDGVMLAAFPRMPPQEYLGMIGNINNRKLPSYSFLGPDRVAQGILFSDSPKTDMRRLARRNALNMQEVMLGGKPSELAVIFETKSQLTLNMKTARTIGLSPSFNLLAESVLINKMPENSGPVYSLKTVAHLAMTRNLQLNAEAYGVQAGSSNIGIAKSTLLPQLSMGASYSQRKKTALVEAGQFAEKSSDGSLNIQQLLYSDSAWANFEMQRYLQRNREASYDQSKLDIVQSATIGYLNILRAQIQLRVQQDNLNLTQTNLELAKDRVRVGSSSSADVYRWESRNASDRVSLLQATAAFNQARENLNRLVHRPINELFQVAEVKKGDPFALSPDEFEALINNSRKYGYFTEFVLQKGFDYAPELKQLESQLASKYREETSRKRAFWLPDFSLSGRYGNNLNQSGAGVGGPEHQSDWDVAVNASLPLFDGGSRRAELSKSQLEIKQLEALQQSIHEQIEQQVRSNIHAAVASYANIDLSTLAANAAKKNLELVTDSYAKGLVSIIDLLDAQNASLQADEASANAVYDFLIDIMNMQRSTGVFQFMMSEAEKTEWATELKAYIENRNSGGEQ